MRIARNLRKRSSDASEPHTVAYFTSQGGRASCFSFVKKQLSQGFYCYEKTPYSNATWERKGLFQFYLHHSFIIEGSWGWSLETVSGAETMEKSYLLLLACSLQVAQSVLFVRLSTKSDTTCRELEPSTPGLLTPQACSQASLVRVFSQLRFLFPGDSSLVQLTACTFSTAFDMTNSPLSYSFVGFNDTGTVLIAVRSWRRVL